MGEGRSGREVRVAPERLAGWVAGFGDRHGAPAVEGWPGSVVLRAPDGAVAELLVPYGPLAPADAADPAALLAGLVAHALRERRLGLVLLRRGGVAVGVADGPQLVTSKVARRHVQGRTAAGGWSQQRFARRRAQQTDAVVRLVADLAARLLVPEAAALDALVEGGDRLLLRALRDDRRLARLWTLPAGPHLDVPDPRRDVLESAVAAARAVRVRLTEP